jgi:hypothetical protein
MLQRSSTIKIEWKIRHPQIERKQSHLFTQQMNHIRYRTLQQTKIASDQDILIKEQTAAEGNGTCTVQDNNLPQKN